MFPPKAFVSDLSSQKVTQGLLKGTKHLVDLSVVVPIREYPPEN